MAYQELSKFMSDNGDREATVYRSIDKKGFHVSVKNETGTLFVTQFDTLNKAEEFAEDWVL